MIDRLAVYVLVNDKHEKDEIERCLWSISNQPTEIDVDVVVNYYAADDKGFEKTKEIVPEEYTLVKTKSKGFLGNATNSCLKHYRENQKDNKWSHMCIINANDYYYPMAFDLLFEIEKKSNFDYLSGMAHHVDTLRPLPPHRDDPRKVYPYQPKRWLWSFVDNRLPVFPFVFWDDGNLYGEDFPLCLSTKAVNTKIKTLEGDHDVSNYFLTIEAILQHLDDKLNFVSTDCNEIYVLDYTEETKFDASKYDEERGYPFDSNGLVHSSINDEKYKALTGVTRQYLPYVTMPQVWSQREKCEFVSGGEIR